MIAIGGLRLTSLIGLSCWTNFLQIMGRHPRCDVCRKLWRDLGLSFGMVFFGVTSLFLSAGTEFSSPTWNLSNRFFKLMSVRVSGLSRKSGFFYFKDFHWLFTFSFDNSIWIASFWSSASFLSSCLPFRVKLFFLIKFHFYLFHEYFYVQVCYLYHL